MQTPSSAAEVAPRRLNCSELIKAKVFLLPHVVRDCYPVYYESMMDRLNGDGRVITITGSRGTGKTMFYGYTFSRYSHEHPNAVIITAAFTDDSELVRVAVFEGGRLIDSTGEGGKRLMKKARERAIARKRECLYIVDGLPKSHPPSPAKMICFTRMNEKWVGNLVGTDLTPVYCMPLWSLNELKATAARISPTLKVKSGAALVDDVIEDRFATFGGVARECLAASEEFVESRKKRFERAVGKLNCEELLQVVVGGELDGPVDDQIGHFVPDASDPSTMKVVVASAHVCSLALKRSLVIKMLERERVLDILRGTPEAGTYPGRALELCLAGGLLQAQKLGNE